MNITNTFTSKGEYRCYFQLRVNSLVSNYHISSPVKCVCSSIVQGGDVLSAGIVAAALGLGLDCKVEDEVTEGESLKDSKP